MRISDLHNDILSERGETGSLNDYGGMLSNIVCAVFRGNRSICQIKRLIKNHDIIGLEDCGYLKAYPEILEMCNPVYCQLTYNGENELGFGHQINKGIKPAGKKIAKMLDKKGIAVDTAHLSEKGFYDIADICGKMINSHTCIYELNPHTRNIDKERIKIIIQKNGLVGLTLVGSFLGKADSCILINHIDYFIQRFGADNLCFGSDFYGTDDLPDDLRDYYGFAVLYEKLLKEYKASDLDKIFYKNIDGFLQ